MLRVAMRVMLVAAVVLLAGCAAEGPGRSPRGESPDGPSRVPSAEPSILPDRSSIQLPSAKASPTANVTVTGVLGADSVEGGCAYLETADGERYQVIYPEGWDVSVSPLELTDRDGNVVATGGETVTVRGIRADDMVSTCQIGPIFRATEVVSVD